MGKGSVNGRTGNDRSQGNGRNKGIQVRNTNTAMGKALAAAMGGFSFDESQDSGSNAGKAGKNAAVQNMAGMGKGAQSGTGEKGQQAEGAFLTAGSLEKRIHNKAKLAEELGW